MRPVWRKDAEGNAYSLNGKIFTCFVRYPYVTKDDILDCQSRLLDAQAYDQIARAKFATEGTNTYPDATFTLRLSFGTVKGYKEEGKNIPYETHFAGLYEFANPRTAHDSPANTNRRYLDDLEV